MADVTKIIELILKGSDRVTKPLKKAQKAMQGVEKATKKTEKSTMKLSERLHHLGGAYQTVKGVATSAFSLLNKGVINLNKNYEETALRIAGSFKALGMAETFKEGENQAKSAFKIIQKNAASLPGEVQDYLSVFEIALPKAIEAGFTDVQEIAKFTSRYTAVAMSQGLGAQQAAMDLSRMLGGQAAMDVRSWQNLKAVMGKAGSSAKIFNKLTAPKRAAAIGKAIDQYGDLIDKFGGTVTALEGTVKTNFKEFVRRATKPLFVAVKANLSGVAALLTENEGLTNSWAHHIGRGLMTAVNALGAGFKRVLSTVRMISAEVRTSGAVEAMGRGASALAAAGKRAAASAGGDVAAAGAVGAVLSGPVGVVVAAATATFAKSIDAMAIIFGAVGGLFSSIMQAVAPLFSALVTIGSVLGEFAAAVLPPVVEVVSAFGQGILFAAEAVFSFYEKLYTFFQPIVKGLISIFGTILRVISGTFSAIVKSLIRILRGIFTSIFNFLAPAIDLLKTAVSGIAKALEWLADQISIIFNRVNRVTASAVAAIEDARKPKRGIATASTAAQRYAAAGAKLMAIQKAQAEKARLARMKGRKPAGRGGRVQKFDFRGSRFDIKQAFAEGFDPDRVAVAFASDLAALGETKMQSGLSPLFSVR